MTNSSTFSFAQQQTTQPGELEEFVPVQGGEDTASAATLLVAAYLVMWAILLGFVLLTFRRQHTLEQRMNDLDKALADAERKSGTAP